MRNHGSVIQEDHPVSWGKPQQAEAAKIPGERPQEADPPGMSVLLAIRHTPKRPASAETEAVEDMLRMIPSAISRAQGEPVGRIPELMEALDLCMAGMVSQPNQIQAQAAVVELTISIAARIIILETVEMEEAGFLQSVSILILGNWRHKEAVWTI